MYHVKVAVRAHMIPCLLLKFRPCGANVISEPFGSVFFSRFRELELCDFLYIVAPIINIAHFPNHVNNKFQIIYVRSKSLRQNARIA